MNHSIRVLHLEDDPHDAELIQRKLKAEGLSFEIVWVDRREAFESALEREVFDLVLTDYNLPDYDGMSALKRAREKQPDLPVIAISGTLGEEEAVECLKAGATDYVLKQRLQRLGAAVRAALDRSRLKREARAAEIRLRESERRFRQMAENIRDVFFLQDADGNRVLYVSPAYEEIWGRSCESVYANPESWTEAIHPDDRASIYEKFKQGMSAGTFEFEYRIVRPDGSIRWIGARGFPVRDDAGKTVRIAGVAEDITERKKADQRFKDLLESAPDAMVIVNRDAEMVLVNFQAVKLFGWRREELLGQKIEILVPERFRGKHPGKRSGFLAQPRARAMGAGLELFALRKDGTEFPVEISLSPLETGEGTLVMSAIRDITERKEAENKISRLNRVYAVLSGINTLIVRVRDRDELFGEACRIAVEHGQFKMAWIGVVDRSAMKVVPIASAGAEPEFLTLIRDSFSLREDAPLGNTLTARAIREKKAIVCNDIRDAPQILFLKERIEGGIASMAILPLLVSDDAVGVLALYADETGFFDEKELRLLTELAGDIAFAIDHIDKQERLDYLAFYDQLTGLANRALFIERVNPLIHAARQAKGKFALAILDIERFRTVNDSLGRQAGDALLKQVAERMKTAGGPAGAGRISADHFALALGAVKGRSEASRIVSDALLKYFHSPFQVNDGELRISAKAGIALFPGDGAAAETLLKNAEAALRKAKELGERHAFYAAELTERTAQNFTLENKLRQALDKNELVLHYQPKIDLETRRIVGVETLMRWQSPELGLVPPGRFIALMESTGLIQEAGTWALTKAAQDHSRWLTQGLAAPRVAVNVSPIQLRRRDFVATLREAIAAGAKPPGIDLEITESIIMTDVKGNIAKLKAVRDLGLSIAIDDFGTGHSSLSYLAKLPVQALKIDRSFIISMASDADAMTLVSTIISLAHSLRLVVIAEGVETEEQARMLRLLRCDQMQGYLFSKPLPLEAMTGLLKQQVPAVLPQREATE